MKNESITYSDFSYMRQKAEKKLEEIQPENSGLYPSGDNQMEGEADYLKLLHELQVHQIELEMQNEELKQARDKAEIATEKYSMLYDFAPMGYFTLDSLSRIIELNFNGAELLGKERGELVNINFNSFVTEDTIAVFNDFFQKIFTTNFRQVSEVKLAVKDNQFISAHIEGVASCYDDNCLLTVVDISGRIAEERARNQLKGKELLLSEVHHRIKNNMNTIYGLLKIQAGMESNSDVKNVLSDVASRVHVMQVLYDKLYLTIKTCEMSLKDYFPDLITEIISIFPGKETVTVNVQIEDIVLSHQTLSMLGIIINELITNSMKYAFKGLDDCRINVTADLRDNHVRLSYEDNGIGLPDEVTFENSTGFGMLLIGMLVKQISGTITMERGEFTKIFMEFDR